MKKKGVYQCNLCDEHFAEVEEPSTNIDKWGIGILVDVGMDDPYYDAWERGGLACPKCAKKAVKNKGNFKKLKAKAERMNKKMKDDFWKMVRKSATKGYAKW